MAAYAERVSDSRPGWQLRAREEPQARAKDLQEIDDILGQLAARLDYNLSKAAKKRFIDW